MTYVVEQVENENAVLKIIQDEDAPNPREDFDNLGTMVCWHRRYDLGDKHNYSEPRNFLEDLVNGLCDVEELAEQKYSQYKVVENDKDLWDILDEKGNKFDSGYRTKEDAEDYIEQQKDWFVENLSEEELFDLIKDEIVILPLYLYDHSGITMNTTGFTCRWDSGQVGWIYALKGSVIKEYGTYDVERAEELLKAEVETYDQYLTGDVYYFSLEDKDGDVIDSCGGFYGLDYIKEAVKEYIGEEYSDLAKELKGV